MRVNEKINSFLGLNNLLDPSSAEYAEGQAYICENARINSRGLWSPKPILSGSVQGYACGTGAGQRQMTLAGSSILATGITCATEGQNGYIYYLSGGVLNRRTTTGATAVVAQADVAHTSTITGAQATITATSRMQPGLYYYMITVYNDSIKRESLPSKIYEVEIDDTGTYNGVTLTFGTSGTYRIYRSKRTSTGDGVYNAPNVWYFLDDVTGTTYGDTRADDELQTEYEGRGTVFLTPDYIVSYNERMLYFKGNNLWWSSSGQPEEVAQKYSVNFIKSGETTGVTIKNTPKLYNGYGEAKKTIPELSGQTITGSIVMDGKLWIFTNDMVGYIQQSNTGEGYIFKIHRRGVGAVSQFVLQSCEHGIFGFDSRGMWLLDNTTRITRLTDNRVDLSTFVFGSTNYGVWCPNLNEYWMCQASGQIVAYQANRDIFVGGYTALSGTAGCSWYSGSEAVGLIGTSKVTEPSNGSISLTFYLGQSSPTTIKQRICVEAIQSEDDTMTLNIGAGASKSTITMESAAQSVDSNYPATVRKTTSYTGRMIKAVITLSCGTATSGLSTINYKYEPLQWNEESGR